MEKPQYVTGVWGMLVSLASPRRALAGVEDVPRYGWPLVIVLGAMTLLGYATVQTGLVDRTVDLRVQQRIAALEENQRDVVERSALREQYEAIRKTGEFERVIMRLGAIAVQPAGTLVTILLITAVLFGAVALTGRKAEWNTLLTIVVYAALIDVVATAVRLGFMLKFRTLDVDTSLALALRTMLPAADLLNQRSAALLGLATAVDPFRIWFWITVIIGLKVTRQMSGWRTWTWCALCWIFGALLRTGLATAATGGAMS